MRLLRPPALQISRAKTRSADPTALASRDFGSGGGGDGGGGGGAVALLVSLLRGGSGCPVTGTRVCSGLFRSSSFPGLFLLFPVANMVE